MPLSTSTLSASIRSKVLAKGTTGARDTSEFTDLCDAIAQAVVEHITGAGLVTVNPLGLAAPPGGGPVTGTCTGTFT